MWRNEFLPDSQHAGCKELLNIHLVQWQQETNVQNEWGAMHLVRVASLNLQMLRLGIEIKHLWGWLPFSMQLEHLNTHCNCNSWSNAVWISSQLRTTPLILVLLFMMMMVVVVVVMYMVLAILLQAIQVVVCPIQVFWLLVSRNVVISSWFLYRNLELPKSNTTSLSLNA